MLCFLSAVASLVLVVVSPANVYGEYGDFCGVFSQKNPLGEAMSLGALAALHGLRVGKRRRLFNFSTLLLSTFLAIKAGSTTSLLAIFMFVCLGFVMHILQKGGASRILGVTGIILLLPGVLIAAFNGDSMLQLLGKDPTLTGRTDVWGYVIPNIYQRPLLGWGYQAFWTTDNPEALKISDILGWRVPQAHNGMLEILLSVGLIGAVMYIYVLGRAFWLSVKWMRTSESAIAITSLLICAGIVLIGVSETVLLYGGGFAYVFFTTSFFCERAITTVRQRTLRPFVRVRTHTLELIPRPGPKTPNGV